MTPLSRSFDPGRRRLIRAAGAASVGLGLWGCSRIDDGGVSEAAWTDLTRRMRGAVLRPLDGTFKELSSPRNLRFAHLVPQGIAVCEDAADVAQALRWAVDLGLPFAIRGGGHNYASASSSSGLIISTRRMLRAAVTGHVLQMQAGVLNRDLVPLLARGGQGEWILPGGNCPNVGVAGATLGGGIGPNAPWGGLAADRLRSVTMVTATGLSVTASATVNPDLFWGLRGAAGGHFGIVTDLQYELLPIPVRRATTVVLSFSGRESAVASLYAWQRVRTAAPRLVCGLCSVYPEAGSAGTTVVAQVLTTAGGARDLLAPLLAIGPAETEIVERDWWDAYAWYITPVSPNYSFWDRSLYAESEIPSDGIDRLVRAVSGFPRPGSGRDGAVALFGWVGGAVSDVAPQATAYVHRTAQSLVEIAASWPTVSTPAGVEPIPADIREWSERVWEIVRPFSNGRSYQNFPDPELQGWSEAYYGSNLPRLKALKRQWDPDNVFSHPQPIPASAMGGSLVDPGLRTRVSRGAPFSTRAHLGPAAVTAAVANGRPWRLAHRWRPPQGVA